MYIVVPSYYGLVNAATSNSIQLDYVVSFGTRLHQKRRPQGSYQSSIAVDSVSARRSRSRGFVQRAGRIDSSARTLNVAVP